MDRLHQVALPDPVGTVHVAALEGWVSLYSTMGADRGGGHSAYCAIDALELGRAPGHPDPLQGTLQMSTLSHCCKLAGTS